MNKILIISSFLLVTSFAKQAGAQSLYAGINFTSLAGYRSVATTLNLVVGTAQITSPGVNSTLSNNVSEGLNLLSGESTVVGPVYYWDAPSFGNKLTFSIGNTTANYLTVQNGFPFALTYYLNVIVTNSAGQNVSTFGPSVTIPAGSTANLYFPNISESWTSSTYFQNNPSDGFPTPMTIVLNSNY
jgi:hypothetical protein